MTRILVIDDDPGIRRLIAFTLADEGYTVDEASEGDGALQLVEQHHPEIIVLDMQMPGVDGWEFAKLYRERYDRQAPIIVLTAAQDAARRREDIDAEAYVTKPFELDELVAAVSAVAKTLKNDGE